MDVWCGDVWGATRAMRHCVPCVLRVCVWVCFCLIVVRCLSLSVSASVRVFACGSECLYVCMRANVFTYVCMSYVHVLACRCEQSRACTCVCARI